MMRKIGIGFAGVAAVALACSGAPTNDRGGGADEAVGQVSDAVGYGTIATQNEHESVVAVQFPGQVKPNCSGILVTAGLVLTANHCVTGSIEGFDCFGSPPQNNLNTPMEVTAWWDPAAVGTQLGPLRLTTRTPHLVRKPTAVNFCSLGLPADVPNDIALLRLAQRLPSFTTAPLRPAGVGGISNCSSGFEGTVVGYGDRIPLSTTDTAGRRSFNTSTGWSFSSGVYVNSWFIPPVLYNGWYEGGLAGDSGGPLIQLGKTAVCGVSSQFRPRFELVCPLPLVCVPLLYLASYYAAVDSASNRAWLAPRVRDARDNWYAECGNGNQAGATPASLERDFDNDMIPDGCDPCPEVTDLQYLQNGTFTDYGPDTDGDGFPDVCDLCPRTPAHLGDKREDVFMPSLGTFLWRQRDSDLDGLGNACDAACNPRPGLRSDLQCCSTDADCASSACVAVHPATAALFGIPCAQRCAAPADADGDFIPQSCDNCPATKNKNQADTDGDGAGDACDNCSGQHDFGEQAADRAHPACDPYGPTPHAPCLALHPDGRCAPLADGGGVCTHQHDADGDGVGRGCDNCRSVPNPAWSSKGQANCNLDIERKQLVPYPWIGDACDRTPCAEYESHLSNFVPSPSASNIWVGTAWHPLLLPPGQTGPLPENNSYAYTGTPVATGGSRHCDCSALAGPKKQTISPIECDLLGGPCPLDPLWFGNSGGPWRSVALAVFGSSGLQPPPPPPAPGTAPTGFADLPMQRPFDLTFSGGSTGPGLLDSAPTWFAWSITAAGPKDFSGVFNTFAQGVFGVFWTHVEGVAQINPGQPNFRPRSNSYQAGFFGFTDSLIAPPGAAVYACEWCLVDPCPHCAMQPDLTSLVVQPASPSQPAQVFAVSNSGARSLTARFAPAVATALSDPRARWVTAAERAWFRSGDAALARISADGAEVELVAAMINGSVQPIARARPGDGVPTVAQAAERTRVAPAPRAGFGAVLSAREGQLFIIGGVDADGRLMDGEQQLWGYDWTAGSWAPWLTRGARISRVLAATYRVEDRSLYVLDEVTNGGSRRARFLRVALDSGDIELLGTFSRSPNLSRVDLVAAPYGRLLLVGSFAQGAGRHRAVLLDPSAGRGRMPRVVWSVAGSDVLATEPALTPTGLSLPMLVRGRVSNRFIPPWQLPSKATFGVEACL